MAAPNDNVFVGDLPASISKEQFEAIFSAYGTVTSCRVLPPKGPKTGALVRFASVDEAAWVVENLNGNLAEGLDQPVQVRFANAPGGKGDGGGSAKGWAGDGGKGGGFAGGGKGGWGGDGGKGGGWGGNASHPYGGKGGGDWGGKGGKMGGKPTPPDSFFSLFGAVKKAGLLGGGRVPEECQVYIRNLPADTTDVDLYKLMGPFGAIAPTGVKAMMNEDGSCKGFGFIDFLEPESSAAAILALNGFILPDGSSIMLSTKAPSKNKDGGEKGCGKGGKGGGKSGCKAGAFKAPGLV